MGGLLLARELLTVADVLVVVGLCVIGDLLVEVVVLLVV